MALQTETYANLLLDIQAAAGVHSGFTSPELTSIKRLVNQRARKAYRESPMWERWLVIGEERSVDTSASGHAVMPYTGPTEDQGFGSAYSPIDTGFRMHQKVPWDTVNATEYQFQGSPEGLRLQNYSPSYGLSNIVTNALGTVGVVIFTTTSYIDTYVGAEIKLENFATSPGDINGTQTVTAVTNQTANTLITFASSISGAWSLTGDETVKVPTAFSTHRKRLDITYGDGSGDTTTVPQEWNDYISFGVAADLKRGDHQYGAARELEAVAIDRLTDELAKLDAQHASETVFKRIRTHGSEARQSVTIS